MNIVPILILLALIILFFYINSKIKKKTKVDEGAQKYQQYLSQFNTPKDAVKLEPLYTKIAGVKYKNDYSGEERQQLIKNAKVGEYLMLIPDEQNKFDEDAVAVVRTNGDQLGYLNTDLAMEVKSRLKKAVKVEAKITAISGEDLKEVHVEIQRYSRKKK